MTGKCQPPHIGHAFQCDAEAVGAPGGGRGQRGQVRIDDLQQSLARYRFAEAEGILGVDVDRQRDEASSGQLPHQILETQIIQLFFARTGPDIDPKLVQRATGVAAVQDQHDRIRPVTRIWNGQNAFKSHRHLPKATVRRKVLLNDRKLAQIVAHAGGQRRRVGHAGGITGRRRFPGRC